MKNAEERGHPRRTRLRQQASLPDFGLIDLVAVAGCMKAARDNAALTLTRHPND